MRRMIYFLKTFSGKKVPQCHYDFCANSENMFNQKDLAKISNGKLSDNLFLPLLVQ